MSDVREFCNLSDDDFEARRAQLRAGLIPQARDREELPDGLALRFDATAELRAELDTFVAFERQCCPGLDFAVLDEPGSLRLEVHGIDPAASAFAGVGAAQPASGPSRDWRRLLRSAGLGAVGAFVLFCVVPIAVVALLGASVAAPLTALDDPWVIGAGTLVFGVGLWRWERRREAARAASAEGCGC